MRNKEKIKEELTKIKQGMSLDMPIKKLFGYYFSLLKLLMISDLGDDEWVNCLMIRVHKSK